jgi:beta-lactamase class A
VRVPLLLLLSACVAPAVTAAADPPADPLAARIAALTRDATGTVTLYARNLDTGREFGIEPDRRVRTASTIKLPILCALAAEIAAGRARWDEPITYSAQDRVSGTGVLQEFTSGTALPLRDLAALMIVVSDNTATNLVLDRISADRVNDYLASIGLTATRSLRKIRGDGTQLKPAEGWSRAGLDAQNAGFGIGVSTPREMVRLLDMLEQGAIVSAEASRHVLHLLERQQHKDGIGRRAATMKVASKGGALDALRSDVGIVYAPGGRVAMAITVDGMPEADYSPDNAGNRLIWEVAQALVEALGAQAPGGLRP